MKSRICNCCNVNETGPQRKKCLSCLSRKRKYNLSYDELSVLREATNCELCNCELKWDMGKKKSADIACIDHCHCSGEVRGVLCHSCNTIEGHLRDFEHLKKIYENLEEYLNKTTGQ